MDQSKRLPVHESGVYNIDACINPNPFGREWQCVGNRIGLEDAIRTATTWAQERSRRHRVMGPSGTVVFDAEPMFIRVRDGVRGTVFVSKLFPGDVIDQEFDLLREFPSAPVGVERIAKLIADHIGHGMTEKCEALAEQIVADIANDLDIGPLAQSPEQRKAREAKDANDGR